MLEKTRELFAMSVTPVDADTLPPQVFVPPVMTCLQRAARSSDIPLNGAPSLTVFQVINHPRDGLLPCGADSTRQIHKV